MTDHFLTHGPSSRCPCGRTVYASDGDCHARCGVCRQVREIGEEIGSYGVCVSCMVKDIMGTDWGEVEIGKIEEIYKALTNQKEGV